MFLTHTELLPEDETIEEHRLGKEIEAKLVAADRSGPGLFKGIFHRNRYPFGIARPTAIRDEEDGVDRCPLCTHELEDGYCNGCGWTDNEDDISYISDEDDRDISPLDDFEGHVDLHERHMPYPFTFGPNDHILDGAHMQQIGRSGAYLIEHGHSEDETDEDEEEDDDDMSSFISNDEVDLPNEVDGDDDDESIHTIHGYHEQSPVHQYETDNGSRSPSISVTAEAPPRFYAIDVSEDSDDSDETGDENATNTTTSSSGDEDSEVVDGSEAQQTNYDSDSSSIREVSPPVIAQPSRMNGTKRRRIIEDDDDEGEEDSDDTATFAPQATLARRQYSSGNQQTRDDNGRISHMAERRRISVSPDDDEPPRQHSRRGGSSFRGPGPRRGRGQGRPAATRVY